MPTWFYVPSQRRFVNLDTVVDVQFDLDAVTLTTTSMDSDWGVGDTAAPFARTIMLTDPQDIAALEEYLVLRANNYLRRSGAGKAS